MSFLAVPRGLTSIYRMDVIDVMFFTHTHHTFGCAWCQGGVLAWMEGIFSLTPNSHKIS